MQQRCTVRQTATGVSRTPVGISVRCRTLGSSTHAPTQPAWTGDHWLSKFVNLLINTPPVYAVMKVLAKQAIMSGAEKRGVDWSNNVQRLLAKPELDALEKLRAELTCPSVVLPSYYLMPFHAYDEGNESWLAAAEVEPATYAMALRTYKDQTSLTPQAAFAKLRGSTTDAIKAYQVQHGLDTNPEVLLDMGCSTGMSTRWLAAQFPQAEIVGLDLCTRFLAVAEQEERQHPLISSVTGQRRIKYVHGMAESTNLTAQSVDLVMFSYVIHECPAAVIAAFVKESKRILKPGGVMTMIDNNPKSATIQNLPPFLFTLMKATEPWSDQYYAFDLEASMRAEGFKEVITVETDHRHRTVLGVA